jgi:hypothetical protein
MAINFFAKRAISDIKTEIGHDFRRSVIEGYGNVSIRICSAVSPVITGRVRTPRQRRAFVAQVAEHTRRYSAN